MAGHDGLGGGQSDAAPAGRAGAGGVRTVKAVKIVGQLRGIHPAPYDGDTPTEARSGIRESSRLVFTNPDMLHASLLGNHQRLARLLRHLDYIVIDECHSYRGVFGANVAGFLKVADAMMAQGIV